MAGLDSARKDWDRVYGVNVIGYSNMVQACYPFMKKGMLYYHGKVWLVTDLIYLLFVRILTKDLMQ